MILGERDRERVEAAELAVGRLKADVELWQSRATYAGDLHDAKAQELDEQVTYGRRLREWATNSVRDLSAELSATWQLLDRVSADLRALHAESDEARICRHCGFEYPCPTIAALPSPA